MTFHPPTEEWVIRTAPTKEVEERKFVVDSRTSMHRISKRDLNSAKLETMKTLRSLAMVMTANGEVQNKRRSNGIRQRIGLVREGYSS